MNKYLINTDWFDQGGSCQVYSIENNSSILFKEFDTKTKAIESYKNQTKLSKYNLAPKIFSDICKLNFSHKDPYLYNSESNWGYLTEKAMPVYHTKTNVRNIQILVEEIYDKTTLNFWDCHWYNVGLVYRQKTKKLVCIDTGEESFISTSNAWGNYNPGPLCCYCIKYDCICIEE